MEKKRKVGGIVDEMITIPDKGIHSLPNTAGAVLAKVFRRFLIEGRVNKLRWADYMDSFVKLASRGMLDMRADMISVRGNTTKILSKPEFTWKVFLKAMKFLQTKRLVITITRTDWVGNTTVVEEVINFKTPTDYKELMIQDDGVDDTLDEQDSEEDEVNEYDETCGDECD